MDSAIKTTPRKIHTRQLTTTAMLCAVAYIAVFIGKIVPNVAGFLSYDPKDAVVVIGGFIFGPVTALIISVIVSFIEMITISGTGVYGMIMNIFSTCAFAIPAALVYKRMRSMKGAIVGLVSGVAAMAVVMVLWNWIITPVYMGVPRAVVVGMLPTVFLPFNLVKGGINATITLLLYKPIITALRKANLVQSAPTQGAKVNLAVTIGAVVVLAAFVAGLVMLITG